MVLRRVLVVAFGVVFSGCTGDGGDASRHDAAVVDAAVAPDLTSDSPCAKAPDGGPPATLANVEKVLVTNCAIAFCHDGQKGESVPGLDLRAGRAKASLVNVPATAPCGGTRVVPGDAAKSFVYHKLTDDMPCDGLTMPRCETGGCPLPMCEIDLVRRWIQAGAP